MQTKYQIRPGIKTKSVFEERMEAKRQEQERAKAKQKDPKQLAEEARREASPSLLLGGRGAFLPSFPRRAVKEEDEGGGGLLEQSGQSRRQCQRLTSPPPPPLSFGQAERALEAMMEHGMTGDDEGNLDEYAERRVHAWVLVLKGNREQPKASPGQREEGGGEVFAGGGGEGFVANLIVNKGDAPLPPPSPSPSPGLFFFKNACVAVLVCFFIPPPPPPPSHPHVLPPSRTFMWSPAPALCTCWTSPPTPASSLSSTTATFGPACSSRSRTRTPGEALLGEGGGGGNTAPLAYGWMLPLPLPSSLPPSLSSFADDCTTPPSLLPTPLFSSLRANPAEVSLDLSDPKLWQPVLPSGRWGYLPQLEEAMRSFSATALSSGPPSRGRINSPGVRERGGEGGGGKGSTPPPSWILCLILNCSRIGPGAVFFSLPLNGEEEERGG